MYREFSTKRKKETKTRQITIHSKDTKETNSWGDFTLSKEFSTNDWFIVYSLN